MNVMIGRFNPMTSSHGGIIDKMISQGKSIVFVVDGEKSGLDKNVNPLSGMERIKLFQSIYSGQDIRFLLCQNAFEVFDILYVMGILKISLFCGSDRKTSYESISKNCDISVSMISKNRNDGISASKIRKGIKDKKDVSNLFHPGLTKNDIEFITRKINGSDTNNATTNKHRIE